MGHYEVARMTKDEVYYAIEWAAREGWNPGLHDADCFYQTDPHGFFVGKLDGKIIAVGSAVIYDDQFAFCGFYIVEQAYRGQGYGLALTKARLDYVDGRNAGIDGVIQMVDKYARLGYKIAHNNGRYAGKLLSTREKKNQHIISLADVDFDQLLKYDRKHFPASREIFLKCWIEQPEGASLGYVSQGELKGFGVIRACQTGFKIGPLFADTPTIAENLFLNLVNYTQGKEFYLDIPENNPHAKALVQHYQLGKVFETARMYLKEEPPLPIDQIYGITSFELG
ncbi:GNAT family N-acetyltransferase [Legionella cardiaca]|uniref:GNAT family N-acetyltransferase n=2 Tax=Legionella cardiaca TaxID=1071983 RepID=A0ABY8ATI4_9GAMM|nr:GNAT family N-acetyltransferase [Legionella cardiaca]WED42447.1 GNAT family N-acetyltransferase [Legionella cardiaca]